MQLGFSFAPPAAPTRAHSTQPMREYQERAVAGALRSFEKWNDALWVMATGTGKTRCFTEVAHLWPEWAPQLRAKSERVLVLAERDELLGQAQRRIAAQTGEDVGREQADRRAGGERIVVASIQTLLRPQRLASFRPDDFGLVIYDEVHHVAAPTRRKIVQYFQDGGCKFLGVTATPDRSDEKGMASVFKSEEPAFCYEIDEAIADGWLVEPRPHVIRLEAIDFSKVRKVKGDLAVGEIEAVIAAEEALHGIAKPCVMETGSRRALGFCPGINSSKLLAAICDRYSQPGWARWMAGQGAMDLDERRRIIAGHQRGDFQGLWNCQVACLDEETEILTDGGWVGYRDINPDCRIANWEPGGRIFFDHPLAIEVRKRKPGERMVSLETPRISMRVTEDHRVLYRTFMAGDFLEARARDIVGKTCTVPICGNAEPMPIFLQQEMRPTPEVRRRAIAANSHVLRKSHGFAKEESYREAARRYDARHSLTYTQPAELTEDDCLFIGLWLGDGGACRLQTGGVEFTLHNDQKLVDANLWIDSLLRRIGVDSVKRRRQSTWQWSIGRGTGFGPQRRRGLYRLEPYLKKDGSPLFWGLTRSQFEALFRGFWMADGNHGEAAFPPSVSGSTRMYVHNTNRALLDLLQAVAVCRGFRCSLRTSDNGLGRKPLHRLYLSDRSQHHIRRITAQYEHLWQDEVVWCVKSHTSWIVARRRGSVFVTGNTEGYDDPNLGCLWMARPTLSRMLFAQMVGRGTRPAFPAGFDSLRATAEERRAAIAASVKPFLMVLEFTGNSGKHSLACTVDMMGEKYDEEIVEAAKKKLEKDPCTSPGEALEKALAEAEAARLAAMAARARVTADVRYHVDPFELMHMRDKDDSWARRFSGDPATDPQVRYLCGFGVPELDAKKMTKAQASRMIENCKKRDQFKKARFSQVAKLRAVGIDGFNLSWQQAADLCWEIQQARGRRPAEEKIAEIVNRGG